VKQFLLAATAMACLVMGRQVSTAQDSATPSGVNGKWHFVLDTPGGDRDIDAEFAVDADGKVTGKFGKTDAAGTYKDGKLDMNFSLTAEETGETAPFKLVGKLDETSSLTGNWEFSSYAGTFKAMRPKA
jgi:hypothetical protein